MLGLALEGGGAKGAFHMGVVKAFLEEGYEFGGITGTSIGALNGAMIAQGDFEAGYQLWENMVPFLLFDIEETEYQKLVNMELDKETALRLAHKVKKIIQNKGMDTDKIKFLLEKIIDERKLRKSKTDFGLVTVSVSEFKPLELYKEDIPEGRLIDYLIASASFPGFKLKEIETKYYIDGGFYDNCPVNLLARKGYREIIAVRTLGLGIVQDIKYPETAVTNIFPSENLGKVLDFNNDLLRRNLQMGYYDAMRQLKGLKGVQYYIEPLPDEEFYNRLLFLPEESMIHLGELFGIAEMEPRRMMFEKIIPKIAVLLGLKSAVTYQDIIIRLFEELAREKGVNRYHIYPFQKFLTEIGNLTGNDPLPVVESKLPLNIGLAKAFARKSVLAEAARLLFAEFTNGK
jgi:NTE family protein